VTPPASRFIGLARAAGIAAALVFAGAAVAAGTAPATTRAADFDAMWRAIDASYAYFDGEVTREAWKRARATWRPRAARAATQRDLLAALEGALETLHDPHVSLSQRTPDSPRRIPSETDIWARWDGGAARVDAVRIFGDADVAGLKPGDIVARVQGIDVERAVRERAGEGAGEARRDEALRQLLAGPRFGVLRLEVRDGGATRALAIERSAARTAPGPALAARRVGDERDLGYIRLRDAIADGDLIADLDNALGYLRDTRGLIVDLRGTAGPPARAATRAFLARFAAAGTPWQVRETRDHRRATDTVPAGPPPYAAPVVVLVDRWSEGEAEALAAGLHEAAHARLVGTPSAGLRGDLRSVVLPASRIVLRFPAERTLLLDGAPREPLVPDVAVDLAAPSGGPGDPILYQGLKAFESAR
jgi:carboxyl-terminal processing protease